MAEGSRLLVLFQQDWQMILNGGYIMENIMNEVISINTHLTEEEKKQLEKAKSMPIIYDNDCPETTPEQALKFRRVNRPKRVSGE